MDVRTFSTVSLEQRGAVARLRLERPAQRNAQSVQLLDELDAAMNQAMADTQTLVVVLAAAGDHFSAGHDLKDEVMWAEQRSPEARYDFEAQRYLGYCLRLWDAPKPVIAEVQGACVAAGFMLANMCDLIVASEDAFFADPVASAFGVAAVEVLVHPWVMGLRAAKHFLYTGGRMTAAQALAIGMVNEVVRREELEDAAMALAERVAQAPSFALRLLKRSLNRTADIQGFRAALEAHFDTHQLSHMGGEAQARVTLGLQAVKPTGQRGPDRRE